MQKIIFLKNASLRNLDYYNYNNETRKSILNFRFMNKYFADMITIIVKHIEIEKDNFSISYYKAKNERTNPFYYLKNFIMTKTFNIFPNIEKLPLSSKIELNCRPACWYIELNDNNLKFLKISGNSQFVSGLILNTKAIIVINKLTTFSLYVSYSQNLILNNVKIEHTLELKTDSFSFSNCSIKSGSGLSIQTRKFFTYKEFVEILNGISFPYKAEILGCRSFLNSIKNFSKNKNNLITPPRNNNNDKVCNPKQFIDIYYCHYRFQILA